MSKKSRVFDLATEVENSVAAIKENASRQNSPLNTNVFLRDLQNAKSETSQVVMVPIEKIDATGNPRKTFSDNSIKELASSIKSIGLLQPITVREKNGKFILIAGERRLRATIINGEKFIEAIIKNVQQVDPDLIPEVRLVENIQREDLLDIEVALSLLEIKKRKNYSNSDLEKTFGKSESWVKQKLSHAKLVEDLMVSNSVPSISLLNKIPTTILLQVKPQLKENSKQVLEWLLPQLEKGIVPKRTEAGEFAESLKAEKIAAPSEKISKVASLEKRIERDKELVAKLKKRIKENEAKLKQLKNSKFDKPKKRIAK